MKRENTPAWGLLQRLSTESKKRLLKWLIAVFVIAAGVVGLGYAFGALRRCAADLPAYRIKASSLRLIQAPRWMTPEITASLDITGELPDEFSLLDAGIAERIAAAYERKAWVKEVTRVIKRSCGASSDRSPLEIHLKFREPVAFVQAGGKLYLVDSDAVRLPGTYVEPWLGSRRLFVISGVRAPPPSPSQAWSAPSVQAGVKVAAALVSRRVAFRLVRIDVDNVGGRRDPRASEIAVYTEHSTRIDWGKPPGKRADILEKTLAEKVAYLDYVYERFGSAVDGDLIYVDIPNETIRRRSSAYSFSGAS